MVCGCAAGSARPGVSLALQNDKIPDRLYSVFAGQEREAVDRVRHYIKGFPPSSPCVALFRNGELVYFMQRMDIEGNSADYIAKDFFNYAMNPGWCQWYTCDKIFDKQHLHGAFTPLCRLSKKLVNSCDLLVKEKGCLALIEGLFICLCAKYNLSAYSGWLQYQPIRTCPDVSKEEIIHVLKNAPDTIFHPVELSDEEKFALMKDITVNI